MLLNLTIFFNILIEIENYKKTVVKFNNFFNILLKIKKYKKKVQILHCCIKNTDQMKLYLKCIHCWFSQCCFDTKKNIIYKNYSN